MKNFLAGLDNQTSDNNDDMRSAKNGILKLGRKYPERVRIIPYTDRRFWYPYRTCWVDLYKKGGKETYPAMLTFSYNDNGDDKLRTLIGNIIGANNQYRKDNPGFKTDKIPLQFKHPGHAHYNATLRPRFALQAIKVVPDPSDKSKLIESTFPKSNIPKPQIMNVSKTVMGDIRDSITSKDPSKLSTFADKTTGKPFKLDVTKATEMRWINVGTSFPVHIYLDDENTYHVDPLVFQSLPALPKQLYDKDSKGNFKYLDDPAYLYEPSKTREPQIYKRALQQLQKRFDEYKESGSNPYEDQIKKVAANTTPKSSETDTQTSSSSDEDLGSIGSGPSSSSSSSSSTVPSSNDAAPTSSSSQTSSSSTAPKSSSASSSDSSKVNLSDIPGVDAKDQAIINSVLGKK